MCPQKPWKTTRRQQSGKNLTCKPCRLGLLHNPQQLPVSLYDMQGRMVYSGTAATVSQPAGVYVVRCAGASSKVLF